MCTVLCVLYYVYCIMCTVLCVLYYVYCIVCTVLCVLYYVYCIVCTVLCVLYYVYYVYYVVLQVLELKERELLQELKRMKGVEGKRPTPPTGEHYMMSRGIRYDMKRGGVGGNTGESIIIVSVGSEVPTGVQVQPRVRDPARAERATQIHGHLPPIVTGLYEEAAADLMATASPVLQSINFDMVRLCLDIPGKQRSKEYYLKTIEEFIKQCQQPAGMLNHIIIIIINYIFMIYY